MSERKTIGILVNERSERVPKGTKLRDLLNEKKPGADLVICNGFPTDEDRLLAEKDSVVFIRRGEIPAREELDGLISARHSPGVLEKCRNAKVGIAGCGGLGSNLAIALARLGVGTLVLADFDLVEPSNLNRQQYFVDQIGKPKVEALAETLARINPYVAVLGIGKRIDRENAAQIFEGCDVVVECFDNPIAKRDLLVSIRRLRPRIPLVTVSGIAGHGPSEDLRVREVLAGVYMVGDEKSEAGEGRGLMAPRVLVASGHQANIVLRIILGEEHVVRAERRDNALLVQNGNEDLNEYCNLCQRQGNNRRNSGEESTGPDKQFGT